MYINNNGQLEVTIDSEPFIIVGYMRNIFMDSFIITKKD